MVKSYSAQVTLFQMKCICHAVFKKWWLAVNDEDECHKATLETQMTLTPKHIFSLRKVSCGMLWERPSYDGKDYLLCPRDRRSGGILFLSCLSFCYYVILSFWPPLLNSNLLTVSARAFVFHMNILCDKTLFVGTIIYCLPCDLDLWVWPIFANLNLVYNFWTVSPRALIFHMSIPCDKILPWLSLFLTLWPWPWSLIHYWKHYWKR